MDPQRDPSLEHPVAGEEQHPLFAGRYQALQLEEIVEPLFGKRKETREIGGGRGIRCRFVAHPARNIIDRRPTTDAETRDARRPTPKRTTLDVRRPTLLRVASLAPLPHNWQN